MQVPQTIRALFLEAGWQPSNHPPSLVSGAFDESASVEHALAVIAEFKGLRVGAVGAGRDLADSDIHFYSSHRPEVTAAVQPWLSRLGRLVAVATAHNDHIIVFVSSSGGFFAFTDPDEQLYSIGISLGEAMERLLLGISYGNPIPRDA
jgi:hypothetical protein